MRENANKYMVDANNMFVWGSSSGAHIGISPTFVVNVSNTPK